MRPLRYSINLTLDGCCDHTAGVPDPEVHQNAIANFLRADALIFGRVIYQMMEEAFRPLQDTGVRPAWMDEWMEPFAHTINAAKKYVVSSTLTHVDWNAEVIPGEALEQTIRALKQQPGKGLFLGGVTLPKTLAQLGLIDEYEFIVHPRIAGHGPYLFAGLAPYVDLKLVDRQEFKSGAVVLRYVPK